jgi:hypothetical protein
MKQLVTLDERRWIAQNAVQEMGSVIKQKVIDLDKAIMKIREDRAKMGLSPYIDIQPISTDMYKTPNRGITFQKDPETGVLYGIALDQDDYGNIRWQRIQLSDALPLDLNKEPDAKIWAVLRFHPDIQGSPWQYDAPYYKVYDPNEVALQEIGEIAAMKKALDRVDKISKNPRDLVYFLRYLGEDVKIDANENLLVGMLLRQARHYPFQFNKKWDSKERSYAERFESARALGIINEHVDKGFMFRSIPLGITAEEAVRFLSRDGNIMTAINNDLADQDAVVNKLEDVKKKKTIEEPVIEGEKTDEFE